MGPVSFETLWKGLQNNTLTSKSFFSSSKRYTVTAETICRRFGRKLYVAVSVILEHFWEARNFGWMLSQPLKLGSLDSLGEMPQKWSPKFFDNSAPSSRYEPPKVLLCREVRFPHKQPFGGFEKLGVIHKQFFSRKMQEPDKGTCIFEIPTQNAEN